jgi:hypothetical protein
MADWVGQCGAALHPLAMALKEEILKHKVVHADESVSRRQTQFIGGVMLYER